MPHRLHGAVEWIRRRTENVVAALLAVMFAAFIVQIVFRYLFNFPVGWSSELSVICWLYIVLLGSAFWLRGHEEIRFDLLTDLLGPRARRLVAGVGALAIGLLFASALPATARYVAFMKVESSSYLNIRMDLLYSVYVVFAVALVVRYAWSAWRAWRGSEAAADVGVADKGYGL
ncbi:MAG: TRAP transporter small permease [Piscinibacter sp.]|nr:TRAP transporter small permease [Piscinibacter sp.]